MPCLTMSECVAMQYGRDLIGSHYIVSVDTICLASLCANCSK